MSSPEDLVDVSFEVALARLEAIVHQLEAGDASLEQSIDIYTEGQRLKAHCEAKLAGASARIERIQLGTDGKPTGTVPFEPASSRAAEPLARAAEPASRAASGS